jgi:hypothetical protein
VPENARQVTIWRGLKPQKYDLPEE